MELENQVVNLELSKRLEELGATQESLFVWIKPSSSQKPFLVSHSNFKERDYNCIELVYPAYTVAELDKELPYMLLEEERILCIKFGIGVWEEGVREYECYYEYVDTRMIKYYFKDENEANSRAELRCYLLENNLINENKKEC